METIKDLRVLKAIIKQSKSTTNNPILTIDKQYKYLTDGYVITPIRYKGKKYVSRYMDGCFYPYITELN
jgi:hypothetical protein